MIMMWRLNQVRTMFSSPTACTASGNCHILTSHPPSQKPITQFITGCKRITGNIKLAQPVSCVFWTAFEREKGAACL